MEKEKEHKCVKIFLINPEKEFLLYQRDNKYSITYPGYWDLIGGEKEENESEYKAIKREIKEETNCEVKNIERIGNIKFLHKKQGITDMVLFKGNINIQLNKIILREGKNPNFFKLDKLYKMKLPSPFKRFIKTNIRILRL